MVLSHVARNQICYVRMVKATSLGTRILTVQSSRVSTIQSHMCLKEKVLEQEKASGESGWVCILEQGTVVPNN